ncbi:iron chelate uptake ABC transporter family permease subunit [Pimelobacter simplex]|uniref:Transport system permease protein n=1 Tax=Nocardioides simplex TaxID=2045 RepID=A0A0A1DQE6_NOCSI|nr:iron ABC transporter permease [Pimelobacter simplex]AIY19564.1 transport system permease protein [Pimelobacter simplex]MCG8150759.1 iron chelate uptake ABC transporter family permease subunit [Pimelobacter simplex]GEB15278.1 Fe3+ dicitrate ABC transporter permease [Pimelobacter simplex]SFM84203.1 iron complex transport system permease protein [Pimelobacter simplex]
MTPSARAVAVVAGGLLAGLALVLAHLLTGRSDLPAGEVVRALVGRSEHPAYEVIVLDYRLPRVLVGLGAGALLAVSGVLVQAVVRNPLAEPATTGVGAGAALAVTGTLVLWPGHPLVYPAALLGALATGAVLYVVGRRSFAVAGVLLGAVLAAVTSLLLVVDSAPIGVVLRWLVGSLNARTPVDWAQLWPWLVVVLPVAWLLASRLNVWALGEPAAIGLGLRAGPFLAVVLLVAVAAAAAAIAAAGAVAFVGLVAPHVGRLLVGADHRLLVPVSAVLGAVLLSLADLAAFSVSVQLPGLATDVSGVPVGAVTALLGAPVLISLVRRESRR